MHSCHLDHIVITAPNLKAGVEFVRDTLGVPPVAGGEHPRMGTHNRLLRLGDSVFLEVIAPNPDAPKPERSRWFGLDAIEQDAAPRLAAWVARTTDIRATLTACIEPLGAIEPMSRGQLNWLISIPGDGSLPFAGIAPVVIEWINGHASGRHARGRRLFASQTGSVSFGSRKNLGASGIHCLSGKRFRFSFACRCFTLSGCLRRYAQRMPAAILTNVPLDNILRREHFVLSLSIAAPAVSTVRSSSLRFG